MFRTLGMLCLGLAGLVILALPVLTASGDAANDGVTGQIRNHLFEASDGGWGYHDGERVWRQREPERITIEELPTLEGRLRGTDYDRAFLTEELSWYGVSLRSALARCYAKPTAWVLGDNSLDGIWLDVNAARMRGLLGPRNEDWSDVEQRILDGLLTTYGLSARTETRPLDVTVLSPGPRWAAHEVDEHRRSTRRRLGDGTVELTNLPVEDLLVALGEELRVDILEGIEPETRCDIALNWTPGDSDSLERALAEQLDLHVHHERRRVDVAVIEGVAVSPVSGQD